jgi:hypothetical protein
MISRQLRGVSIANGILTAAMDFSACREDEFHDWYDLEHVPERLRIPGFLSAKRWIDVKNPKVAVATYDLKTVGVLQSAPYVAIAGASSSPWTKRTAKFRKGLMRYEGEQLFPGDKSAPKDAAALLLIAMNVASEHEAEFNERYNTEHIPALGGVKGMLSARCYRGTGCDAAIYRALPSRLVGSAVFNRMEGGSEHPVDRAYAAALSRPFTIRMPALLVDRLYLLSTGASLLIGSP